MRIFDMIDENLIGKDEFYLDEDTIRHIAFEEKFLRKKYKECLKDATCERDMQLFFETNPYFLPGLYARHNGPLGNIVVQKLKLGNEYETDFAFLSVDSGVCQITLIEIESPTVQIFRNSDNHFSSNFNKAIQQMRDWALWIEANKTFVKDEFRRIYFDGVFKLQQVTSKIILIAGRRKEIMKNAHREKRWAGLNMELKPHEVMSYDRLLGVAISLHSLRGLICRPARYIAGALRAHQRYPYV